MAAAYRNAHLARERPEEVLVADLVGAHEVVVHETLHHVLDTLRHDALGSRQRLLELLEDEDALLQVGK